MSEAMTTRVVPLAALPTPTVVALAVLALVLVLVLHRIRPFTSRTGRWGRAGSQLLATYAAWWLCGAAASRWLLFSTPWALGWWTLLGAAGTEAVIALYRLERTGVSRAVGGTLLSLRLTLLVIVLFWIAQPSLHKEWSTADERFIAVMVDDSASMHLTDADAPAHEKLDLAQLLGVELNGRPAHFREPQRQLADLESKLASQLRSWELTSAVNIVSSRQVETQLAKLKETTAGSRALLMAIGNSLKTPGGEKLRLEPPTAALAAALQGQLKALSEGPLSRLDQWAASDGQSQTSAIAAARDDLRQAVDSLRRVREGLARLPLELDAAYWSALPAQRRQEIEAQTNLARSVIARRVLQRKGLEAGAASLVEKLHDGYTLKFYHFASGSGRIPAESYDVKAKTEVAANQNASQPANSVEKPDAAAEAGASQAAASGKPATVPSVDDSSPEAATWRSATDLAAALKQVDEDQPRNLSGVIVVWDGRHNANDPVQTVCDKLKAKSTPVISVLIGSRTVPKDAAVAGLDMPQTIMAGDQVAIKAEIKLDGYRGQDVVARLMRGAKEVARKTIQVLEDRHRGQVEFSDTARQVGTYAFKLELLTAGGTPLKESVSVNNSAEKVVRVSDDRIKMLLIEAQPRWEFRYLKNLFAGPDRLVHLQYLLTQPTQLADAPPVPRVHVSASRPYGQFEGALLPENEKEWMKFDVILLGDVSPATLTKETIDVLNKFVYQRGGTLIVVAGADYMPHAYGGTKLAEMLPMRTEKIDGSLRQGPERGYHIRLTDEGSRHVVMKQQADQASADFWRSLPIMYWRHPKVRAKEGAIRLAYAENAYQDRAQNTADQERRERDNCLICYHAYGAGKVMMLAFDETWRMRYRLGVAHHHRFWGQMVRWAADEKLAAGTLLVRLGTDRPRYDVGQPITIKARLLDEKANPVAGGKVEAKVYQGAKLLHTVPMQGNADNPGRYEGQIAARMEAGVYRVELAGPTVDGLLSSGEVRKVETEIAVTASKSTSELVELTAYDAIAEQLAKATRGAVVAPLEVDKIFPLLGPKSGSISHEANWQLWDRLPVLLLFLVIGSGEWILRKKAGLT